MSSAEGRPRPHDLDFEKLENFVVFWPSICLVRLNESLHGTHALKFL